MANKKEEGLFFIGQLTDNYEIKLEGRNLPIFLNQFVGHDIEVVLSRVKVAKTMPQVRYWFGVMIPYIIEFIRESEGIKHSRDTIHAFLMSTYGGMKFKDQTILGRTFQVVERASLADMSKEEASQLIQTVIDDFALKGLDIPSPSPSGTLSDY